MNPFADLLYPALPVAAQNAVCTAAGFARYRTRFGPHFRETLALWEQSAAWPRERLLEYQRERLVRTVRRAREHVPYHRDLPPPSQARDPERAIRETLDAIPPLEKSAYRDQPEGFLARDVPRHRLLRARTSGTTGTALPLWYTAETLAEEYAALWRLRRRFGAEGPSDPDATFNGNLVVPVGQRRPPFWRTNGYLRQTLFSIFHMAPENLAAYVEALHAIPVRYVQGYPSSIHLMARALLEHGRPLPRGRLAAVFTSSESLLAFQRETIEEAFGAPTRDRYGVSELCGSLSECSESRLHVDLEFCIVEVEERERTEDAVTGPLLLTGLAPHPTPFLRYRIGDVGTLALTPCPCGRPGDSFLEIDGRTEDYVKTPDGRLVGRLDHVFKAELEASEAQILQEREDAIEVLVVPRSGFGPASERRLRKELRARLGEEIEIGVRSVHSIPREANGKFRAVKSHVGRLLP